MLKGSILPESTLYLIFRILKFSRNVRASSDRAYVPGRGVLASLQITGQILLSITRRSQPISTETTEILKQDTK